MNEEEFDSLMQPRPYGTEDAKRADNQLRRTMALGVALFGRSSDHLQRQLLAPHPEIPVGFDLEDFRELLRNTAAIASSLQDPRNKSLYPSGPPSPSIFAGNQRYTQWEARAEVVRRAIEYLERRRR